LFMGPPGKIVGCRTRHKMLPGRAGVESLVIVQWTVAAACSRKSCPGAMSERTHLHVALARP
jgi:hypothetical protein